MRHGRADFPDGFLFGAATAAYQIEGHGFGGAGPTHWDSFAATPGNVANMDDGRVACDHYHRYLQDLDLVQAAGFDAYRFSTSWARVMPAGGGAVNAEGLDFYDRLVDAMLARGLRPFVTLYHWELPSALADRGGWANRDTACRFADFAGIVHARIGDRVAATATINEPWCIAFLSHFLGRHAPGLRDIRATARAMHHVLLAHGMAVERLREAGAGNLGIVLNFEHLEPASDTAGDRAATDVCDAFLNRWYLEAIVGRSYPEIALGTLAPHMPRGWQDDMATISRPIDWLGVNYYTRQLIRADEGAPLGYASRDGGLPKTQMGWEIHPRGLTELLMRLRRALPRGVPVFVTENGMARDDRPVDGEVNDPERIAFIDDHLGAVRRAIAQGADIRGYFCWSLLDNFEWAEGFSRRFGLVYVDYDSQHRIPKASYFALKDAIASR